jgi:hypothetical protein
MLRLGMLFWMLVAIGVGLLLYNVKHEVQGLEQDLARINREIGTTHERIHVLHAEWSLLNEPERLRTLSERHLDLVPMRPAQFVDATAIASLPVAGPRGGTAVAKAEHEATPQPVATRAAPAAPPPATRPQAEQRRPPRAAEARPEEPPARLAPPREEPLPPPRQVAPTPRRELEAAAPRPLMPASPAAQPRAPTPVVAVSAAPPPQQPARAPSASSLGGPAVSLPPPVPFSRPQGGN